MKKQLKWNVTLEDRKWKVEVGTSWKATHVMESLTRPRAAFYLSPSLFSLHLLENPILWSATALVVLPPFMQSVIWEICRHTPISHSEPSLRSSPLPKEPAVCPIAMWFGYRHTTSTTISLSPNKLFGKIKMLTNTSTGLSNDTFIDRPTCYG